jgi:hypothetical protein
MYQSVIA